MHMMNDEVSGFVIVRLYLTQKAFAVVLLCSRDTRLLTVSSYIVL